MVKLPFSARKRKRAYSPQRRKDYKEKEVGRPGR